MHGDHIPSITGFIVIYLIIFIIILIGLFIQILIGFSDYS